MSDVIVVGGGVVGTAVTRALARSGAAVTLLDAQRIGAGTSRATFAWVNANQKTPRSYFDLNVAGMRAHTSFANDHDDPSWYHEGGNIEWAIDAPARAELARKAERLEAWGYEVERLTPEQARRLEPDVDVADDAEVVYFPDETWIDPVRLAATLVDDARRAGADVVTGAPVADLIVEDGRVTGVVTADHLRRSADTVVNCAGPAAGRIADLAGARLPMANTPGLLAYTEPVPVAVHRILHTPKLQVRPDGGGRLILHAESQDRDVHPGEDVGPSHPACRMLLSMAQEVLPGLSGTEVEAARAAVRPIPADGLSVVGWHPEVPNLYTVASHSAATLCLVLAEHAAREVVVGERVAALDDFRPSRFLA